MTEQETQPVDKVRRVVVRRRSWESSSTPEPTVLIDSEGNVTREDGTPIGYVTKGTRTYSPPTHKGSRIARYHKQVAEWHGWSPGPRLWPPDAREDTRLDVIRKLMDVGGGR